MSSPLLHLVLFQPEIPQNTGNVGRLCAFAGARLHLIHPLGFPISDRHLRRAGMDYWYSLDIYHHANWQSFLASPAAPSRLWIFTAFGTRPHWQASYAPGDGLVFGRESSGLPPEVHQQHAERLVIIPRFQPGLRSLNLSTAVGIGAYEAYRQLSLAGHLSPLSHPHPELPDWAVPTSAQPATPSIPA